MAIRRIKFGRLFLFVGRLFQTRGALRIKLAIFVQSIGFTECGQFLESCDRFSFRRPPDLRQAFGAQVERPTVRFFQAVGAAHIAVPGDAVFDRQHVASFMSSGFQCSFKA